MDRSVGKLQTLVRIPTVSYRDWDTIDTASFDGFVEELRAQFPLCLLYTSPSPRDS